MTYAVKSTLPENDLKIVGEALEGALVDVVDLSLAAKQIHWNVIGARFRSIHLQLDDVVATARTYSDTIAERSAALGISPDGRSSTVSSGSSIGRLPEGWQKDNDAIHAMVDALAVVIRKSRERMDAVGKADPVTEDIFIQLTGELEKHHWMFQAENGG